LRIIRRYLNFAKRRFNLNRIKRN